MSDGFSAVDEMLPPPRLAALGLQHVLVMYAGAVAVPLILAGAAGLPPDQRAFLISADILACGLATLVQAFGLPGVGIRLPVMMGVTFASVAPMLALIGAAKEAARRPDRGAHGDLRIGHRRRGFRGAGRAADEPADRVVSARRDRLDHHGDRHFADAHRHRLGRGAVQGAQHRRRAVQGRDRQSEPRLARWLRAVPACPHRHPRPHQIRQGLSRQHLRAARHRRRRDRRGAAWQDEFRRCRRGGLFWRRHAVPVRPARLPARADRHDVRRDDRGDDRIDRHVPRARRHDRQEARTRRHHARLARRWRRHDHRRHPQRLSLYVVLAERWAGRCHRHSLAFCRGGGRPDPDRPQSRAQARRDRRGGPRRSPRAAPAS